MTTRSDGSRKSLNLDGYAVTIPCWENPGQNPVTVPRTNKRAKTATTRVCVKVGE